jgi:hypothetical protein
MAKWYNAKVRAKTFCVLAFLAFATGLPGTSSQQPDIQTFILSLQAALQEKRYDVFLQAFSPELRDGQKQSIDLYFRQLKMETVSLYWANRANFDVRNPKIFLQAIYHNSYSALVETWQLGLEVRDGAWLIKEKIVRGSVNKLYKIKIPADRVEKVDSIEIFHADIRLAFKNAVVFYDNIPDLDTALLVIGQGTVTFSPSDANERHQLSLIYRSPSIQDAIEYVYVRCSPSFFQHNIEIKKKPGQPPYKAADAESARASALFGKYAFHYFTIQTSLSPDPLSFLPQGDEATFEFVGRKTGEMSYVYSDFADEEITLYNRTRGRFINLYSPNVGKDKRRLVITFGEKFDVEHYDLEVAFDPDDFRLSAKATIRLRAEVDGLNSVRFKLNPVFEILRIYDAERRELFFTQDKVGRVLYVYLWESVPRYQTASIEVIYRGRLEPPPQLVDAAAGGQQSSTLTFLTPRYETYLFSQSAYWYPSPSEDDYATARLKIIIPPGYKAIATGRLAERGTLNGIQRVTELDKVGSAYAVFETKSPVKYLAFLAGKLNLTEERSDAVPLSTYVSSDVSWLRRNFLDDAQKILTFYEDRFGPYPFETLRLVQRLWPTGGGHSPASFVVLNEVPRRSDSTGVIIPMLPSPNSPVDLSEWKEYFLAHEIAHQWWGQAVTWASYRDQWLSEGLAQFASALYLRSRYHDAAYAAIIRKLSKWTEKKSVWGPISLGSRLSYVDFPAYQAIIYDKAALVLNMLKDMLGDEAFFSGLKEFSARHKYTAASTGQFKAAMEKACGRSLDPFFDLWFNSHLLPEVRVSRAVDRTGAEAVLRVRVDQLNDVFVFPLWVSWTDGNGNVHREKMIIEQKTQDFAFTLPGRAKDITVNPDRAVPGRFILAGS